MSEGTLQILDPTATGPLDLLPLAPALTSLRGRVLGIRLDHTWQSFARFAEVVREAAVRRWQVRDVVLFDPGVRIGTTDEERQKVAGFVSRIDAAIVGLGT
jgi:hypothetical protein